MAYVTPRPSSTTPQPPNPPTHQGSGDSTGLSFSTSQAPNHVPSPIDWANFMNFQTPPGPPGVSGGRSLGSGSQQGDNRGKPDEQYAAFAQGIAISRSSPQNISFQHPYPPPSPSRHNQQNTPQQPQYVPSPSPLQQQLQLPTEQNIAQRSPSNANMQSPPAGQSTGKGKSVSRQTSNAAQPQPNPSNSISQSQPSSNDLDNGLALDPSAFSRDIRFQVPPFLSNQMTGAPTFPPGGEAWSGFSGANFFSSGAGGQGQPAPGQLFGQPYDAQKGFNDNEASGGGRHVLNGLNGFMGGDGGWDSWMNGEQKDGVGMGTTFYVNPNPSTDVVAKNNQRLPNGSGSARSNLPQLNMNSSQIGNNVAQSPRTASTAQPSHMSSPTTGSSTQRRSTANPSPRTCASAGSMQTSAILPQVGYAPLTFPSPSSTTFPFAPSINQSSASTINIASSSTAPYAPPSNTQALLQGPGVIGPSLSDGPGLYSTTGFDMVGVLSRVAARKDPKTVLGPVDLSCSFLVVDIRRYDAPIVYASPTFTALTGYDLPQILGRNCRFLQSPDSDVVKGSKRKYTDNVAVAHLKRMLNAGKECQASLINYRRGGIPFINLVTVVPIPWDGTDIVYHVGFQVDLVEQPNAILRNMRDGSYQVNYTVTNPPQSPLRPPGREAGATGLGQEILDIMGARVNAPGFGQGEDGAKTDWLKMVLENADDFIHVLSLKGMFQYVSPSVRRVLEYDPEDLLSKNISDICHPSDIVPLMRELKDSTHAPTDGQQPRTVNLVFRIRRKSSGYVWIECTGRLHVEPGKGRKAVILSGRARSVPTLPWDAVSRHGGLAQDEFWAKVSYHGLILHATSTVADLLGQPVDDVVGQSFFSLLPGGENSPPASALVDTDPSSPVASLASALRSAVNGETRHGAVNLRHKMGKKSGSQVEVVSVIYAPRSSADLPSRADSDDSSPTSDASRPPSDSSSSVDGSRPSSLVIQVKLLSTSMNQNRNIVHAGSANVFEELETTRGTSWQYELHQLRLLNRRLKEDIAAARARGGSIRTKGNKRKAGEEGSMPAPPPPPVPKQYAAAPRHQLAPGFGLVAPGMASPYF